MHQLLSYSFNAFNLTLLRKTLPVIDQFTREIFFSNENAKQAIKNIISNKNYPNIFKKLFRILKAQLYYNTVKLA